MGGGGGGCSGGGVGVWVAREGRRVGGRDVAVLGAVARAGAGGGGGGWGRWGR